MKPIPQIGERYESTDSRDGGRVVEVIDQVLDDDGFEYVKPNGDYVFHVRTEVNPNNPSAVGNVSRVSERTLQGSHYRKVSR